MFKASYTFKETNGDSIVFSYDDGYLQMKAFTRESKDPVVTVGGLTRKHLREIQAFLNTVLPIMPD